jgi:putative ABC transport system permease protein
MILHLLRLVWHRKRQSMLLLAELFASFLVLFAVVLGGVVAADNWRRPLGFEWEDVWFVGVRPSSGERRDEGLGSRDLLALRDAVREFSDVRAAAYVDPAPFQHSQWMDGGRIGGRRVMWRMARADDGLPEVLGIKLVGGRWFSREDDGGGAAPMVVSESFAHHVFGTTDVIGRDATAEQERDDSSPPEKRRIIGVIADFRQDGELMGPEHYAFQRAEPASGETRRLPRVLLVRVAPGSGVALEEKLLRRLERERPGFTFQIEPLAQMRSSRNATGLIPLATGGIVGLFLMIMVALGLSGVLWQNVTQRTREIGLRRAHGAAAADVFRQVLAEVALLVTLAVAAGVALVVQVPLMDLVSGIRPGVFAASLALAVLGLYGLALASAAYPARLAASLEPAEALRYE